MNRGDWHVLVVAAQVRFEIVVQAGVLGVTGNLGPRRDTIVDVGGNLPEFMQLVPMDDEADGCWDRDAGLCWIA